jgi:ribulose-phosphate 3-epimerase
MDSKAGGERIVPNSTTPQCRLAPSILSFDLTDLRGAVATMASEGSKIIHLDVMDGQFVPPITFGDAYVKSLRSAAPGLLEAHLMINNPEAQFDAFIAAGCERLIFHHEATRHSHRVAQNLRERGVQAGIAINPGTCVECIEPVLEFVDLVLVMTVNPGWGGQKFIEPCLKKVSRIREICPGIDIEVDGGIDPVTLPIARAAGANVFVVGSYLAKAHDLAAAVKEMNGLCD